MKKSILFEITVVLMLSLTLIGFGILIGSVNMQGLSDNIRWVDILSAIGSILAGAGALLGVLSAIYVGRGWKKQNKLKDFVRYYELLIKMQGTTFQYEHLYVTRAKASHPNLLSLDENDNKKLNEILFNCKKYNDNLIYELATLKLLYTDKEVDGLNLIDLRSEVISHRDALNSYDPNKYSFESYESIIEQKRVTLDKIVNQQKDHIKQIVKKT
ncbi:hypothetical protein GNP89_18835 [Aliivibrio fischeri]|uniref:hypothetical protein n=1 Tax=Aliivibrio fischeri TaxID=668 RepID=UPI0012D9AD8C|nr:hypothetical protein [Aliivibrio fischeri]MUL04221.1 hypothetical protein [Aliivibrio fischeri]